MAALPITEKIKNPRSFFGFRHIQYVMLFIAINICYGIRSILSIAIFPMTADNPPSNSVPTYPEWAPHKNMMLSSFFWGYIVLQIGVGQLIKRYGPRWFLGGAVFVGSLFCALIPTIGGWTGYGGVIFCRVMTGLTQGFLFPCCHCLLSTWVACKDRATIGTFVYAGGPLGNVISMPIAGLVSNSSFGWPVVFYFYGLLGMLWSIVWVIIGSDCPAKHPTITLEERQYIEQDASPSEVSDKVVPTPWKAILTSFPFWAILITHCGQNFGFWTLLTETPSYMNHILDFDLKSNSTLSSLPYLVNWILSLFMSPIADFIIVRQYVTVGQSRKIFNSIGLCVPALTLICLTFVDRHNTTVAIFLITAAVGFNAAVYSGYNMNHIDISPVHAGTLMAMTNSFSNIFSLISPLVVDAVISITGYQETEKELWTIVFCLASGIYIVSATFFDIFASGEVQPWNNPEIHTDMAHDAYIDKLEGFRSPKTGDIELTKVENSAE